MASFTQRLSALWSRVVVLSQGCEEWQMGESYGFACAKSTQDCWTKSKTNLRTHRFTKRQNNISVRRQGNRWRKKVKGRKRHIVTDTMGNLLAINVHAANTHDTKAGIGPAQKAVVKYYQSAGSSSVLLRGQTTLVDFLKTTR